MLKTIQIKDTDKLVAVAQYLTKYAKILKASEIFDDDFKSYIIEWQKEHNLTANGIINDDDWEVIYKELPTCSTSKNKKSIYTCAIQILIGGLEVDGQYGPKTKKAVAAFQSACGLEVDGICGPKTWAALICGKTATPSTDKILNECVNYLQWDKKWKNVKYSTHTSKQTIGNSGCGTTSMAMILATWEDPKITPVETSKWAVDNGYRTYNSGTDWGFFKWIFKKFDCFEKYIETSSIVTLEAALREGALAVCSMNPNDNKFWTSSGHYIVARGVDNTYFYANDPNKDVTLREQKKSKFKKCLKQAFIFWPKKSNNEVKIEDNVPDEKTKLEEQKIDLKLDGAIIDISKWQGKIDFSKLKNKVSLVITRASCGSDKDIKLDEYAKEMIKYNIPFGVYCYSYASTAGKAKEEVKKMIEYSSKYNPLFYVMDAEESKITNLAIKTFAEELRANNIKKIGCYVAHNHYNDYNYASIKDLFDFTWIPRYGKNNGTVEGGTKPAFECDLWQYTSTGKIAGINGNVDMNITMNKDKDIKWFLKT